MIVSFDKINHIIPPTNTNHATQQVPRPSPSPLCPVGTCWRFPRVGTSSRTTPPDCATLPRPCRWSFTSTTLLRLLRWTTRGVPAFSSRRRSGGRRMLEPPRHSLACLPPLLCTWEKVEVGPHHQISKQVEATTMDIWCCLRPSYPIAGPGVWNLAGSVFRLCVWRWAWFSFGISQKRDVVNGQGLRE